ncbi:carbohydrate-binding family 9-like protein [Paenibacillus sp. J5C_2022]|uniref:carbohydrate-binding family 9-like protein n=1 Tax=Paenibacillus sp. J5C2022 TaxID=2977129 RepID=UPI0021D27B61|nr:carbohydrate-binding family 9-like protein [Paenibacillus sp. J5C2022]MCU6712335.1 carbohydrate-binding family 9-like protein [Paenibacillus sp. J5C2022]
MNISAVEVPLIDAYEPKSYICQRASSPLALDGRLDKPFWKEAPWTEHFVDIEGDLKPLPSKRTRVKMLWDDDYFYFGAELEEDEIWATLEERDAVIFHDNDFEIFIDPDGDTHQYYEFEINALNTVWDLMLVKPYRDGGPPVNGWDIKGLRTAVHIDGELNNPQADNRSWSVEVAMPWNALKECAPEGRPPMPGEYWRVNFSRVQWQVDTKEGVYRKRINPQTKKPYPEDNWVWSPMGLVNMHYPELWGYVVFADDSGQPSRFQLPQDEGVKWQLRQVYYWQRNYYAEHGRYCTSFQQLAEDEVWPVLPAIACTGKLFQASLPSSDGTASYYIREDGKLWRE